MFKIDYFRVTDGIKVTVTFETEAEATQWAKDTGRPAARIYQAK